MILKNSLKKLIILINHCRLTYFLSFLSIYMFKIIIWVVMVFLLVYHCLNDKNLIYLHHPCLSFRAIFEQVYEVFQGIQSLLVVLRSNRPIFVFFFCYGVVVGIVCFFDGSINSNVIKFRESFIKGLF